MKNPKRAFLFQPAVVFLLLGVSLCAAAPLSAEAPDDPAKQESLNETQRDAAIKLLRETMVSEDAFVNVHAAEYLLSLDRPQGVKEDIFLPEEERYHDVPGKRIGMWRVLARATYNEERDGWIDKIWAVYRDESAEDRGDAIETLAKLHAAIKGKDEKDTKALKALLLKDMATDSRELSVGAAWLLAESGDKKEKEQAFERLSELLDAENSKTRFYAAYALRHIATHGELPKVVGDKLLEAYKTEEDDDARMHKLTAAAIVAHQRKDALDGDEYDAIKAELVKYAQGKSERHRYHATNALAELSLFSDLPVLLDLQQDDSADVRATAAWATLRLGRRTHRGLAVVDWIVIGLYVFGMVAVGFYYSRKVKTTDDYLLGGRNMNAISVGLSLFATLLSTITYLSWPGEMIRFGPMMLAMVVAYPFVFFLAGYFMIPFIMKLRITSAYELLETRLGLPVRLLGSSLFLLMRLAWMAVIIYATTATVLIPLLGLDESLTPLLCAILGVITIVYTSMGGLRAVVFHRRYSDAHPLRRGGADGRPNYDASRRGGAGLVADGLAHSLAGTGLGLQFRGESHLPGGVPGAFHLVGLHGGVRSNGHSALPGHPRREVGARRPADVPAGQRLRGVAVVDRGPQPSGLFPNQSAHPAGR